MLSLLIKSLAWLRIIPFAVVLLLYYLNIPVLGFSGDQLFLSYSTVICCFMAGTIYGQAIYKVTCPHRPLKLIISNLVAFGAFLAWLLLDSQGHLAALIIGYFLLNASELKLREQTEDCAVATSPYLAMRVWITSSVLLLHITLLFLISVV